LAALVLCAVAAPAAARPFASSAPEQAEPAQLFPAQRDSLFPAQREGGISLAQATAMAQSRFQGRVVRAETVQMGNRLVHEIRILGEDGRVRTVRIDAQTGAFL
jgi:uncharacterized membrane protein YkoI